MQKAHRPIWTGNAHISRPGGCKGGRKLVVIHSLRWKHEYIKREAHTGTQGRPIGLYGKPIESCRRPIDLSGRATHMKRRAVVACGYSQSPMEA
eukprot:3777633-Pleurochrysis_carterae.AAC.1